MSCHDELSDRQFHAGAFLAGMVAAWIMDDRSARPQELVGHLPSQLEELAEALALLGADTGAVAAASAAAQEERGESRVSRPPPARHKRRKKAT